MVTYTPECGCLGNLRFLPGIGISAMIRSGGAFLIFLALVLSTSQAKRPEVATVYYGNLEHNTSQPLVPSFTGEIVVLAELNGVEIASEAVPLGDNAYFLRVPLDDGTNPRLPGTARFEEQIQIFIANPGQGLKYVVKEGPFTIPAGRGDLETPNLSVDEDLLGSPSPEMEGYAVWKPGFLESENGFAPLDEFSNDTLMDNDGDGLTNIEEFLAGTDPLSPHNRFEILQVLRGDAVSSIKFGPIRLSRLYNIYAGGTPGGPPWIGVGSYVPSSDADFAWIDHLTEIRALIYRVSVELE